MKAADSIYDKWDEPQRGCLLALRQIIIDIDANLTETVKYSMPCFCYGTKPFCYLWTDKHTNHPYILMVDGNKLNHPQLVQGDRKRMKTFYVDPGQDIPVDVIREVLQEGLALRN